MAAQRRGGAVDLVLQRLGRLDYPPFIPSCRVAEWRWATGSGDIAEQYDVAPLEVHLEPLAREEQIEHRDPLTGPVFSLQVRGKF